MAIATDVTIAVERPPVIDMDVEQSRQFFDNKSRTLLGIGGEEFLRRWHAGEYAEMADDPAHSDIMYLALLGTGGR